MELTQLGSKSITLINDDEPTIATNTRSAPPPQPNRARVRVDPSSIGESVPAELAAAPPTEHVLTSVAKPDRGFDMPAAV
eukprot:scaffold3083_cov65-Phaeocystis_antarctica.AAC.1